MGVILERVLITVCAGPGDAQMKGTGAGPWVRAMAGAPGHARKSCWPLGVGFCLNDGD